jgi:hypothetical protein
MENCEHCGVVEGTPHDRSCPEGKLHRMAERVVDAVTGVRGDDERKRQLILAEALLRTFRDEEVAWAIDTLRTGLKEAHKAAAEIEILTGDALLEFGLPPEPEDFGDVYVGQPDDDTDHVDNPQHYGGRDNAYEAIKVMLAWHGPAATRWFCQLNAEKYLSRAGKKGPDSTKCVEDLRKAGWYAIAAADILEHGKVRA